MSRGPRRPKNRTTYHRNQRKDEPPEQCEIICKSCHYTGPLHVVKSRTLAHTFLACCPECHSTNIERKVIQVEIQNIPDQQLAQMVLA